MCIRDRSICGLGSVDGLCGANCRHSYHAFIPGISLSLIHIWFDTVEKAHGFIESFNAYVKYYVVTPEIKKVTRKFVLYE